MSREQAEQLAELMQEGSPTRPAGVLTATLLVDGEDVRLVAIWQDFRGTSSRAPCRGGRS
jgi:hypothetical protein